MNKIDFKKAVYIIGAIIVSVLVMWYYAMIKFDNFIVDTLKPELEVYANNITYDQDDIEVDRVKCRVVLKNIVISPNDKSYMAKIDQLQVGFNIFQQKVVLTTVGEKIEFFEGDELIAKISSPKFIVGLSERVSDDKTMRSLIDINVSDNIITTGDGKKEIVHILPGDYNMSIKPTTELNYSDPLNMVTLDTHSRGFIMSKEYLATDLRKLLLRYGVDSSDHEDEKFDELLARYSDLMEANSDKYLTTKLNLVVERRLLDLYKDTLTGNFKDPKDVILSNPLNNFSFIYSMDMKNVLKLDARMDTFKEVPVNLCAIRVMNEANKIFFTRLSKFNSTFHEILLAANKERKNEEMAVLEKRQSLIQSVEKDIEDFINFIGSKKQIMFNFSSMVNKKEKEIDIRFKIGADGSIFSIFSNKNSNNKLRTELFISRPQNFLDVIKLLPRKLAEISDPRVLGFKDYTPYDKAFYDTLSSYEGVIEDMGFKVLAALNEGERLLERKQFKSVIILDTNKPFSESSIKVNGKLLNKLKNKQVIEDFFKSLILFSIKERL